MADNHSRLHNTVRNFKYGAGTKLVNSLLGFISRSIFIYILGKEYLGINGLYASILNVLSLTELGLSDIIVYSLYKPLAENDTKKLSALMNYYKQVYRIIALAIGVIGVCLVPFLRVLVKSDIDTFHLILYYLMFLADSVCSYLLVYKSSIIHADQKVYMISLFRAVFKAIAVVLQILVLLIFRNFTLYLAVQIGMTVANNFYISRKADKLYPFIRDYRELPKAEKKKIFTDVRHMFSYKAGGSLLNGTDNLYISSMINTATVGLYANYTLITDTVSMLPSMIQSAVLGSIGNLNASETDAHKKEIFDVYCLMFSWMATFCTVSLMILYNDFITLWIGEEYLLPVGTVAVICLNYFLPNVLVPVWSFRNTTGLFRETKNILLYAAAINLVLSYFLGKSFGLMGILAATSVSRLATSFWFEPYILFKRVFKSSCMEYFARQLVHGTVVLVSIFLIAAVANQLKLPLLVVFCIKMVLCILIPNGMLLLCYYRRQEFLYVWRIVRNKVFKR